MQRHLMKSKIHRATITEDLLDAADLVKGERQLHGAAARPGVPSDPVILLSHGVFSPEEAARCSPRVVFVDDRNRMVRPPLRAVG
ncbi:MAG TPA: aspartate 1-decarboxylase [Gemmatimonadales bacterium]|nr:aspartate 1-decarboxylase [Gemmatimonadales bacterium]